MPLLGGATMADEEIERFWKHHDRRPPVMGPPVDIGVWEGAKGFDGKPLKNREGRIP